MNESAAVQGLKAVGRWLLIWIAVVCVGALVYSIYRFQGAWWAAAWVGWLAVWQGSLEVVKARRGQKAADLVGMALMAALLVGAAVASAVSGGKGEARWLPVGTAMLMGIVVLTWWACVAILAKRQAG